ncbi:hypothetical protein LCGC14_2400670, partial [marine sediment metagenome]
MTERKSTKTKAPPEKPADESVQNPAVLQTPPPEHALATQADVAGLRQDIADARAETADVHEDVQSVREGTGVFRRDAPTAPPPVLTLELEARASR